MSPRRWRCAPSREERCEPRALGVRWVTGAGEEDGWSGEETGRRAGPADKTSSAALGSIACDAWLDIHFTSARGNNRSRLDPLLRSVRSDFSHSFRSALMGKRIVLTAVPVVSGSG
jgi:hypothetical protein